MAYSKEQWELTKEYYEAGLSLSEISKKTKISRPQISKMAKKKGWKKETEKKQLIDQAVVIKAKKETLKETALKVHNEIVDERTKHILFFKNSALKNQKLANEKLDRAKKIQDLEAHARLTSKNKETVLGKDIDTQINIQNNNTQNSAIKIEWE